MNKVCCIIPSRINSSRFPGKPLAKINGRELVLRVCDIAKRCQYIDEIIVATEDKIIHDLVVSNSYKSIITDTFVTCTHRVSSVTKNLNYDYFINIQGDEPCLEPSLIDEMIKFSLEKNKKMVQGVYPLQKEDIEDEDCVKAIINNENIIYLTRNPEVITENLFGISGVYVYDKETIDNFLTNDLRLVESWQGLDTFGFIGKVPVTPFYFPSRTYAIDRPSDISKVEKVL